MTEIRPYRRETPGVQPDYDFPPYRSTALRAPKQALIALPHTLTEITGPIYGHERVAPGDSNLTIGPHGEAIGDRIIVTGRVLDEDARPVRGTLVELWQANAAGRYFHPRDSRNAPLDPNFTGGGRAVTDDDGWYRFITIKPGYYPWGNHDNAWRPVHIHFSLFGPSFVTRLITQMYFPDDPMLPFDPIYLQVPERVRHHQIAKFDYGLTEHAIGLAFRFDIVLRGRDATPTDSPHAH